MDQREQLRTFIQTRFAVTANGASTVGYDDDLLLSGLLDSMAIIALVAFIKDTFGVDVPPEDVVIEHFATINAIDHYLSSR